ncbi:MAG: winged helix-turn-helix domain-containing protein, partial [Acidobacteria bacterium]|nr:winged helix-turn-helix domain-containing protein [Acidobacteriota bacterium]
STRELIARVRVLFRRIALTHRPPAAGEEELLTVGSLELDLQRYTVRWSERPIQLTVTEFLLLQSLARRPGHVKTRRQLMEEAYPNDAYVSERTIDSHIKRLRRKFVQADGSFDAIDTVYGLGYRYRA